MNGEPIYVVALGAMTPVGCNAWSSAAAVRCGISTFAEHPYMIDTAGEPMRVALVPHLNIDLTGAERLEAMLVPAIDQVLEPLAAIPRSLRTAIAIALPGARPGVAPDCNRKLLAALNARHRDTFAATAVFENGHAAGLLAIAAAHRKFAQGGIDACVVAGVDSYMEPETLEWLEECDQLHSAGPLNNAWGFIPGEGAGAVLLVRAEAADQFGDLPLAQLLGVGTAMEPNRIKTQTVCIGEGLTEAFRGALQTLPQGQTISDVYCDMNGEPYRADEYGFSCLRTKEYFESASNFVAPADCWGDVSAAGALLHIGLAAIAGSKGYASGTIALTWASSEQGERGAAVLRVPQGESNAG